MTRANFNWLWALSIWMTLSPFSMLPAQEKKELVPLGAVMDSLALRYDLDFAYDAAVLRRDSLVSSALPKVFDKQWISTVLSGPQNLEVVFMGQQVIVGRSTPGSRPSALLEVSGRVLAADGSGGLPMVNIGVEGRALGTSTNDEGRFVLRYPRAYIGEALVFSSLGFVSERFSLPQNDSVLEVALKNYSIHLPEVQVLYTDPDQLMRSVRRRLAQNYPSEPFLLTAFFRETIRQDDEYVEVSEAVVDIYKPSYQAGFASERVRFVKGRKGATARDMEVVQFKLLGGPFHFAQVDVVRNGDFLPDEEGFSAYRYLYKGVDMDNDRVLYRVGFEPLHDEEGLFYRGELRIDKESRAVVRVDFELTPASIRRSRSYLVRRDSRRFRTRPVVARYHLAYRPWGQHWVLSRVRGEVSLRVNDRDRRQRSLFATVSEMLVSDFAPADGQQRIPWSEAYRSDYVLSEQLGTFDPDFWQFYNVVEPDEDLRRVFQEGER